MHRTARRGIETKPATKSVTKGPKERPNERDQIIGDRSPFAMVRAIEFAELVLVDEAPPRVAAPQGVPFR